MSSMLPLRGPSLDRKVLSPTLDYIDEITEGIKCHRRTAFGGHKVQIRAFTLVPI